MSSTTSSSVQTKTATIDTQTNQSVNTTNSKTSSKADLKVDYLYGLEGRRERMFGDKHFERTSGPERHYIKT